MYRRIVTSARALLVAVAAATVLVAAAPPSSSTEAAPPPGSISKHLKPGKYSHHLARQMNAVRERHGLRPLQVVTCLNHFAAPWAHHMARSGDLVHQDLGPLTRRCNLSSVGEIIAYGGVTPRRMIGMWLDSPGHRALLLEPSFRIAGVAGRRGHGGWWGCIDFGRR